MDSVYSLMSGVALATSACSRVPDSDTRQQFSHHSYVAESRRLVDMEVGL